MDDMNVPKLRFKEFTEPWVSVRLGDVFNFKVTNSFSREHLNYEEGKIKNIHYGDIHTKFQTLFDITKENVPFFNSNISIDRISEDFYCKEGDLIFADASEDLNDVGKSIEIVNLNNEKLLSGLHTLLARPNKNMFSKGFLGFLFKSKNVRLQIQKESQGSKVLSINVGRLSNIIINYPLSTIHQQKIADFLSAVDEKIQALKKKHSLLEQYKKGVMQKMFNGNFKMENGKLLFQPPTLRFKPENKIIISPLSINNYPDWEVKKLGEVGTFQTSSIDKLSKENEKEVFLVNYMNVYRHENINNETVKSFQIVTAKDNQIESCNLKKGDILFTPSSETPDDIGHSVVIFEDLENAVFSYHLMRFRPIIKIDLLYSHYFCNIPDVLAQLSKLATGSTRFTISVASFSSVLINLPCLEEQTAIANFLSALDEKINQTQTQIEKTETWKKGLLQKMFV